MDSWRDKRQLSTLYSALTNLSLPALPAVRPRMSKDYSDTESILPQPEAKLGVYEKVPQHVAQTEITAIVPHLVAQSGVPAILPQLVANIPWGHNILLLEKVKDLVSRFWYMEQVVEHGYGDWSDNARHAMCRAICDEFEKL